MRLSTLELQWFRGAGASAKLELEGKSQVIFGPNGAGKSSFADGLEACTSGGKLGHLSHEYSGRHQEKGIINTARPDGSAAQVIATLANGSTVNVTWAKGAANISQAGATDLRAWDYRRTALRQEELADFIRFTKAEKYSAVLPLLGLGHLEITADNLRKIDRAIDQLADVQSLRQSITTARQRRSEVFGEKTNVDLISRLGELAAHYMSEGSDIKGADGAQRVIDAIQSKIDSLDAKNRELAALKELSECELSDRLKEAHSVAVQIANISEPLVKERLEILAASVTYSEGVSGSADSIHCPACGSLVPPADFSVHVVAEQKRLEAVREVFDRYHRAITEVCDLAVRVRTIIAKSELAAWRDVIRSDAGAALAFSEKMDVGALRKACGPSDIAAIEKHLGQLIASAAEGSKAASPAIQTLLDDQVQARTIRGAMLGAQAERKLGRVEALKCLLVSMESEVRDEIKCRARKTFEDITADVQKFWSILQPRAKISDVRLHVPDEADKAVEICLKFYDVDQESPRLTLSEGQRNSLGLCIFLAMAKANVEPDAPIFLDDVVISLDRAHRSNVASLLVKEFADRQVVIFTHEREWFFELERILPKSEWRFRRILPYSDPAEGIRFADTATDFEKARKRAQDDPEDGLHNARRIMDVALAGVAERLELALPYLRGDDNDHRTAGQFLVALERAATRSFERKGADGFEKSADAVDAIRKVKPELAVWGNRGTHTFSGSKDEAETLIDDCEALLAIFNCETCSTPLGFAEGAGGHAECRCGQVRWRRS